MIFISMVSPPLARSANINAFLRLKLGNKYTPSWLAISIRTLAVCSYEPMPLSPLKYSKLFSMKNTRSSSGVSASSVSVGNNFCNFFSRLARASSLLTAFCFLTAGFFLASNSSSAAF